MRNKPLIFTLAAVLLLGGVYGFLVLNRGEEPIDEEQIYQETGFSSDAVTLTEIDMMTIMHFKCETLEGETVELEYTVNGWKVPGREDYPIDDTLVEEVIKPFCNVKSDRMLTEDKAAFAQYGLEPARFHVELTDSDGKVYAFNVGDKHDSTHKYYFNIEGEDKIYTVPTGVGMNLEERPTLASYIKLPTFPAPSASTTESIIVETGDRRTELVHLPEGDDSCYSSDYTWFLKQEGQLLPLSEEEFTYFTNALAGMGIMNAVEYSDDEAVLAQYGLVDGKQHAITMTYESASKGRVTEMIYIGQGADGVYARVDGSWIIGTIVNKFDFFNFDYDRFKANDFFKMPLSTVDQMTILLGDKRYVVKADRTTEADSDGTEKTTTAFTWNGNTLKESDVVNFFNNMRNTVHEGNASAAPEGAPALEITFDRNTKNFGQMTLKLWPYDNSFYISEFNGSLHLINKLDANAIIDSLETALASQAE